MLEYENVLTLQYIAIPYTKAHGRPITSQPGQASDRLVTGSVTSLS